YVGHPLALPSFPTRRSSDLAARRERVRSDGGHDTGVACDRLLEPFFELVEIALEPGRVPDRRKGGHAQAPVCSATMPPANVLYVTCSKPASRIRPASSSGPGKRRTLAGRYA